MSSNLRAALVLTLKDELSSGLDRIKGEFEALKNLGRGLTLGRLEQGGNILRRVISEARALTNSLHTVAATADRTWAALKRMGSAAFGPASRVGGFAAVAEGYSVAAPIRAYAGYENTLRHIAITEKLSGVAVEAEVARLTKNLAREALETGQNSSELAKAYNFLITTGMSSKLVDQLMPSHARAATAYNISSESMGQAVFALNDSFKIGHEDIGAALSAMAYAAKEAHFTVENFSQFLPAIGGRMQLLGMTGRGAADTAFAALETVVKNSSMPSQAATNLQDLMQYMTSPIANRSFAKMGIDLPAMLVAAEKKGINPLDALLGKLDHLVAGKSPVQAAEIIGKLIHNQEAASAALSLLQHKAEFLRMRTMLGGIDATTLNTDFNTAMRASQVQVRQFEEELQQLQRRVGQGFAPILHGANQGLDTMNGAVKRLDDILPGLGDDLLLAAGGFLSFGAAIGALGVVGPIVARGWGMVSPVIMGAWNAFMWLSRGVIGVGEAAAATASGVTATGAAVALALVAAAADIYVNWDRFGPMFHRIGAGLLETAKGFWDLAAGFATADISRMGAGFSEIANGGLNDLVGKLQVAAELLKDLVHGMDWISGGRLSKFKEWMDKGSGPAQGDFGGADPTGAPVYDPTPAAAKPEVHIYLHADPGTEVRDVTSPSGMIIHLDNAGRMLGGV